MMQFPNIDPVAISLGPLEVHWYGISYLVGFLGAWILGRRRAAVSGSGWTNEQVSDLLFYGALGVILGGRVGYMFFYKFSDLLADPISLFYVWQGGMSFHGGLLGVLLALYLFSRASNKSVFKVVDFIAPMVPIGLGAGRMANFINAELWGRVSDVPWAMVFPTDPSGNPRHPSQLYECALEGFVLFTILWLFSKKPRPTFVVSSMFCMLYGVFRTFVEFYRQPDSHLNFVAFDWLTRGMELSIPMIIVGAVCVALAYKYNTFDKLAVGSKHAVGS